MLTFHGAYRKDAYLYPRFERVKSLETAFPAHVALADPTMLMDPSKRMLLSWYLGGLWSDPTGEIRTGCPLDMAKVQQIGRGIQG